MSAQHDHATDSKFTCPNVINLEQRQQKETALLAIWQAGQFMSAVATTMTAAIKAAKCQQW